MHTWVFGYGSLVWRPDFPFSEKRAGLVRGWSRRFWQGSTDHRGVPGAPGRVVTLVPEPAGEVVGMAYALSPDQAAPVLAHLDHREKGGYAREHVTIELSGGGQEQGLVYRALPGNPNWLGPAPEAQIAAQVARSRGPSGPNPEYLLQLQAALAQLGQQDPHLDAIVTHLHPLLEP